MSIDPNSRRRADRAGLGARMLAALALLIVSTGAAQAHELSQSQADFAPPVPGSYRLERIQPLPDGAVLDSRNRRARLAELTQGRITLLSLMYTSCSDPSGCPMALYTLQKVRRDLEQSKSTGARVRMVSLSFDPEHDTPEVMRAYGGSEMQRRSRVPWEFVTARSPRDLRPVLDGLGQDVRVPVIQPVGENRTNLTHMLKVFLIDRNGWVREIYTSSYLVPRVIVNDVQTLLLEDGVKLR
jgi:cytochrome oxidase Cu insertion factor (SCO1/SenC/PrrC family)